VSLIPAINDPQLCRVVDTGNASFAGFNETGNACNAGIGDTGVVPSEPLTIRRSL
jgi:hypothetical protein